MRRIGLFGGSFNPPHLGHCLIAEQALEQLELDSVIWMPAAQSPLKSGDEYAESHHRLQMVRLATRENPRFEVSTMELDRPGLSFTIDTLRALADLHPSSQMYLLIGADSYLDLHRWKDHTTLPELATIAVYPRPGCETGTDDPEVSWIEAPRCDVSSTDIRRRLRLERSVRYQVLTQVRSYILEHKLYAS